MSEIIAVLAYIPKEISDNLILGIVALAALVVEKIFIFSYNYFKNIRFSSHQNFTISGTWLTNFPSYTLNKDICELVRISQDQEKIRLYIEHHNDLKKNNFLKLEGSGVFRANKMSAVYYPKDSSDSRSGVFVLRTNGGVLNGRYAEFESTKNGYNIHKDKRYTLKRIRLPLFKRIKMKLRIQCFKNYDDLKDYWLSLE